MSQDLGRDVLDLEKLYARKLWADFSFPKITINWDGKAIFSISQRENPHQ